MLLWYGERCYALERWAIKHLCCAETTPEASIVYTQAGSVLFHHYARGWQRWLMERLVDAHFGWLLLSKLRRRKIIVVPEGAVLSTGKWWWQR